MQTDKVSWRRYLRKGRTKTDMLDWIQDLMTKEIGYGLQGIDLLLIGLAAFFVGMVGPFLYRYYRRKRKRP